jgi:hypothetical protein
VNAESAPCQHPPNSPSYSPRFSRGNLWNAENFAISGARLRFQFAGAQPADDRRSAREVKIDCGLHGSARHPESNLGNISAKKLPFVFLASQTSKFSAGCVDFLTTDFHGWDRGGGRDKWRLEGGRASGDGEEGLHCGGFIRRGAIRAIRGKIREISAVASLPCILLFWFSGNDLFGVMA